MMPEFFKKTKYPLLLFFCWLLAEFLVNPIGEFPLNDDWSYTIPVKHLTENGTLQFVDWPAMTLVAQVWWGYLFTSVFGFSFTVLRISVAVLGFIGGLILFQIIKKLSGKKDLAFAGTLLFLFNPLYFSLSNSFMTDVPFLSFSIIACYFYVKVFESGKFSSLLFAAGCSVGDILVRQ